MKKLLALLLGVMLLLPASSALAVNEDLTGKVVIYTPSIASREVQVPEGEDFKTVATAADCQDAVIEVAIAPAVQTDALRILVTGLRPEHKYSEVWEVEAYAQ